MDGGKILIQNLLLGRKTLLRVPGIGINNDNNYHCSPQSPEILPLAIQNGFDQSTFFCQTKEFSRNKNMTT